MSEFDGNIIKDHIPKLVKNKINKRNRLLKIFKRNKSLELKTQISNLNFEIRSHFFLMKKFAVRKGILPGNSKTLWKAVKTAKNVGHTVIPNNMTLAGEPVTGLNIAERFAEFFDWKVNDIVRSTIVYVNVYNGRKKTFTTTEKTDRIKILNKEIKSYFHVKKCGNNVTNFP